MSACSLFNNTIRQEPTTIPTITSTPTEIVIEPAATQTPSTQVPADFKQYQDLETGISVYIPQNWFITGIVEGQYAIFQSYPEDKYIGGQQFQTGDTKCDLNLGITADSVDDLIQQWKSDPMTTIISQQEIILASGLPGVKFEIDNLGPSKIMLAEINGRVVAFTCFGEFDHFDEIANSMMPIN